MIQRNFELKIELLMLILATLLLVSCVAKTNPEKKVEYIHNEGKAQGTYYSATYLHPDGKDLQAQLDSFFNAFDLSLSTYNPKSLISRINRNDTATTDHYFETIFEASQIVSEATGGAFDITVAPLVNAWGFGFGKRDRSQEPDLSKFMPLIGFNKVKLINHKIIKENEAIMIDVSAIAQGYSADLIAEIFEKNGCEHYMIDIGGEIVCKGSNPKGKNWQIGIDKPVDDSLNVSGELQTIISITNRGLTTSGNYRQFYLKDGKKYAHTINPKTGRPVNHNLLSATVVAANCTTADAYATAFMVLGKDSAMALCKRTPDMDCYLIFTDKSGKYQVVYTDGFKKYLTE